MQKKIFTIKKNPLKKKHLEEKNIEYIRTVWKISRLSGRFPDSLEDFQTVWKTVLKISGQSERFPYSLGNVLDSLEDFPKVWKILRQSFFYVLFKFQIRSTFKGVLVQFHEIFVRFANNYTLIITSSIPHYSLSS